MAAVLKDLNCARIATSFENVQAGAFASNEPTISALQAHIFLFRFTRKRDDMFNLVYKTIYRSEANYLIDGKKSFGILRAIP